MKRRERRSEGLSADGDIFAPPLGELALNEAKALSFNVKRLCDGKDRAVDAAEVLSILEQVRATKKYLERIVASISNEELIRFRIEKEREL